MSADLLNCSCALADAAASCAAAAAAAAADSDPAIPTLSDADHDTLFRGKLGMIAGTFIITMAGSLSVWGIRRLRRSLEILSVSACFAAGIILGAGFSHLLPDAQDGFSEYFLLRPDLTGKVTEYPWVMLIAVFTLILLIWVDFSVIRGGLEGVEAAEHGHSHAEGHQHHSHAVPSLPVGYVDPIDGHVSATVSPASAASDILGSTIVDVIPSTRNVTHHAMSHGHAHADGSIHFDSHAPAATPTANGQAATAITATTPMNGGGGGVGGDASSPDGVNPLEAARGTKEYNAQAWVFFVALAIHSVFDGLGLGAADTVSSFYALLAAVLTHKGLDGFALGVPVFMARWPARQAAAAIIFCALMTPVGIGIGMAATDGVNGTSGVLSKAIILSMSAGSFVFISLIELLPAGLRDGKNSNLKMFMLLIGWGLMAFIAMYV